jgi:hypothetical protein
MTDWKKGQSKTESGFSWTSDGEAELFLERLSDLICERKRRRPSTDSSSASMAKLVSAYYYLRVAKLMYFDEPAGRRALEGSGAVRFVLSLNGLAVLVFGMDPGLLLARCATVLP